MKSQNRERVVLFHKRAGPKVAYRALFLYNAWRPAKAMEKSDLTFSFSPGHGCTAQEIMSHSVSEVYS